MIVLMVALLAAADPCDSLVQQDMNRCSVERSRKADAELAAELARTLAWARENQVTGEGVPGGATSNASSYPTVLAHAQDAWEKFRDAECSLVVYPYHGGSMAEGVYFDCMASLTEQRIKALRERRE